MMNRQSKEKLKIISIYGEHHFGTSDNGEMMSYLKCDNGVEYYAIGITSSEAMDNMILTLNDVMKYTVKSIEADNTIADFKRVKI